LSDWETKTTNTKHQRNFKQIESEERLHRDVPRCAVEYLLSNIAEQGQDVPEHETEVKGTTISVSLVADIGPQP
jgi:hypothetical protein